MSTVACFLYSLSKKLAFVPVASAMTAVHRDRLVLASYAPRPKIQPLESRGQFESFPLTFRDLCADIYRTFVLHVCQCLHRVYRISS